MKILAKIISAIALSAGAATAQAYTTGCDMSYPNAYVVGVSETSAGGLISSKTFVLNSLANGTGLARGTIKVQAPANTKLSANDDLNTIAAELDFAILTGMKVKSVSSGYGNMMIYLTGTTACYTPIPTTGTYLTDVVITTAAGGTNSTSIGFGK